MILWLTASAALAAEVRGMTVSTPTWGWEWGTAAMDRTLDELGRDGVNWVSIHPYARITQAGEVDFRPIDPEHPPDWLARPIREAHVRGQKVMIVPHIAHWGSGFSWRGAIAFPDPEASARFFRDYEAWILTLARATSDADAFVVGSELDGTVVGEATEWRGLIGAVRGVFPGPLTYAANWDDFERIPFWDAVDAIGVQAYFPLTTTPGVVDPAVLDAGWDAALARIRALSARTGKHVVFTELGYDRGPDAAVRPWEDGSGGEDGEKVQAACLAAALRAIDREPAVVGAFLWKWMPDEAPVGNFRMSAPEMRAIIRSAWSVPTKP
jgi:hypothetical protein